MLQRCWKAVEHNVLKLAGMPYELFCHITGERAAGAGTFEREHEDCGDISWELVMGSQAPQEANAEVLIALFRKCLAKRRFPATMATDEADQRHASALKLFRRW